MTATTTHPSINPRIKEFFDEFGEELDTCNPGAYDLLVKFMETGEMELINDFVWYYADELDACCPEAFDLLYEISEEFGIEMY